MGPPGGGPAPDSMADPRRQKYEYYGTSSGSYVLTSTPAGVGKYLGQDMDFRTLQTVEKSMQSGLTRLIFVCPSDKTGGRVGTTVDNGGGPRTRHPLYKAAPGRGAPPPR